MGKYEFLIMGIDSDNNSVILKGLANQMAHDNILLRLSNNEKRLSVSIYF